MPLRTNADGSMALLLDTQDDRHPSPKAQPPHGSPDLADAPWTNGACGYPARTVNARASNHGDNSGTTSWHRSPNPPRTVIFR